MPARVRGWLVAVLVFGLVGTLVELVLLAHYEDPFQFVPLALIAAGILLAGWHQLRPSAATVRAFQGLMTLFLVAGVAGSILHMRGAAEFQLEINPSMPARELAGKILRAQSPPALAPGVMLQMGLVGLIAVYRHPAIKGVES